jgi:hypothetical protein
MLTPSVLVCGLQITMQARHTLSDLQAASATAAAAASSSSASSALDLPLSGLPELGHLYVCGYRYATANQMVVYARPSDSSTSTSASNISGGGGGDSLTAGGGVHYLSTRPFAFDYLAPAGTQHTFPPSHEMHTIRL